MRLSQLAKPITKSKAGHRFISWSIAQYLKFVYKTTKWTLIGFEEQQKFCEKHKTAIVLQWHNRIGMAGFGWPAEKYPISLLVSDHTDGRIVGETLGYLGMGTIYGSSSKGGAKALMQCIRNIKDGRYLGMSPDGPRGPRLRVKDGPAAIAKKTGAPVCMITYSIEKRKTLKTWDRFIVPKPFGKGVLVWKALEPISPKATAEEMQKYNLYLENELTQTTNEADAMMGHSPIEPATPEEIAKIKINK